MTYLLKLCTISLDNGAKICVPYSWTVLERLLILIVGMLMGVLFWYFTFRRIKGSPSLRDSVRGNNGVPNRSLRPAVQREPPISGHLFDPWLFPAFNSLRICSPFFVRE